MNRRLITTLILLVISTIGYANQFELLQLPSKKKKKSGFNTDNILIGPGIGFGAAQRSFFFNLAPSVGYTLSKNFYAGATFGVSYFQLTETALNIYTNRNEDYRYRVPAYSASIYARALLGNFFMLNFEPEITNTKNYTTAPYADPNTKKLTADYYRITVPSVLVGVGYCQKFSSRLSHSFLMACYDLVQNPNSRYYQTIDIRAGIMISLGDF